MSNIAFVVNKLEFKRILRGKQISIFREKSKNLMKKVEKKYASVEIRNGICSNRPKAFFKFIDFEEQEDGYRIHFGAKIREENMQDALVLVGERL